MIIRHLTSFTKQGLHNVLRLRANLAQNLFVLEAFISRKH